LITRISLKFYKNYGYNKIHIFLFKNQEVEEGV